MCFVLNLRMPGENCLIFNWHSSRAAPVISFFGVPTKNDEYEWRKLHNLKKQHCCSYYSWYGDEDNLKRQIKSQTFWVALPQENIKGHKLNSMFYYISNWSKVLEFYLTSFFNMKRWRVKFRHFLGNFPVHYAALFINRTINNNYMTLLMAFHHTNDRFWYFFRCFKSNAYLWYTSNFESANKKPSLIRVAAFSLM